MRVRVEDKLGGLISHSFNGTSGSIPAPASKRITMLKFKDIAIFNIAKGDSNIEGGIPYVVTLT